MNGLQIYKEIFIFLTLVHSFPLHQHVVLPFFLFQCVKTVPRNNVVNDTKTDLKIMYDHLVVKYHSHRADQS